MNFLFVLIFSCTLLFTPFCNAQDRIELIGDLGLYSEFSNRETEVIVEFISYLDSTVSVFHYDPLSLQIYCRESVTHRESDLDMIVNKLLEQNSLDHLRIAISKLIKAELIDDFWVIQEVINPFDGTGSLELKLNPDGKYFQFISVLAAKSEIIHNYYNHSIPEGAITPGMVALLFESNVENIDFRSESYRLLWIIHYIVSTRATTPPRAA